ncbi:MAG: glycosyltransferase family 2 protein, partial [Janthinobacterium lividum]
RLLNSDGTQQDCTFRFTGLLTEVVANCLLPRSLDFLKAASIDPAQFQNTDAQVDWVLGACIVIRKSTLAQIGLLDAVLSPIGNGEEVDWCLRARRAGWVVSYCPRAVLTHLGGQTFNKIGGNADKTRIELKKTSLRFAQKHFGLVNALTLRLIFVMTLPWNVFMLTQTFLRRRSCRIDYLKSVRSVLAVARVGVSRI